MEASEKKTIKKLNQLRKSEQMVTDINEDESEIYKELKEFNTINTSIDDILERVSNMIYKEIKYGVFNGSIPSRVYDLGATSICGYKDDPFIAT